MTSRNHAARLRALRREFIYLQALACRYDGLSGEEPIVFFSPLNPYAPQYYRCSARYMELRREMLCGAAA